MTTTPTSAELLPCPFCGSKAWMRFENHGSWWVSSCEDCGANFHENTEQEAIAAWNRRAAQSQPIVPEGLPAADVPNAGPWHDWSGGECPVAGEIYVDVTYANGVQSNDKAHLYYWRKDGASDDIIAWRYAAVTPVPAEQEPTSEYSQVAPSIPQPEQTAETAQRLNYVATVAPHCDRIVWRGKYYALPIPVAQQSNALPKEQPALSDEQIINLADMSNFGWKDQEGFWHGEGGDGTSELLEFARAVLAAQGGKP